MDLSAGQDHLQRIAQSIDQNVDLGAQATSAFPYGLISVSLFGASAVLMCAHDRAVYHRVFVVGIDSQQSKDRGPHTARGPAAEPLVGVFPTTQEIRQIAPGNSGSIAV